MFPIEIVTSLSSPPVQASLTSKASTCIPDIVTVSVNVPLEPLVKSNFIVSGLVIWKPFISLTPIGLSEV